ncbi:hypothetical protein [Cohnella silvisoli]|uniref:NERD domain-containing protein n=1 Tax=Cohnella silvisoli TaxID=2873699 RepID=A0ABV1L2K3_9BACL|nr:hypothetical protein [Cohnella silvisoli]MCD9025889.1 hypothetical protein [Cohnella silvisoli]
MSFEKQHAEFIAYHLKRRSGERRGRLERGHAHGEKLFLQNTWWPMFGNFDHLHPEYEILDLRGKPYFADFVYFFGFLKFIIEIKGFNSHIRDMDRMGFCGETNRELFMQGIGYRIFSFAFDDVANRPDLCISLLRMNLSQYQPSQAPVSRAILIEKEVIRLALGLTRYIRPIDVEKHFEVNHRTAIKWLRSLVTKGWLRPVYRHPQSKILEYEVVRDKINFFF